MFSVRSEGVCWESLCWSLLFCSAFVILSRQTQSCINWRDILWPTTVRNIGSYCPRLLMKSHCFSSSCSTHLEADYWRWWYFLQNDSACSIFFQVIGYSVWGFFNSECTCLAPCGFEGSSYLSTSTSSWRHGQDLLHQGQDVFITSQDLWSTLYGSSQLFPTAIRLMNSEWAGLWWLYNQQFVMKWY